MSGSRDSRTEMSSSTMNTMGLAIGLARDMVEGLGIGARLVTALIPHLYLLPLLPVGK
jgi:hypothetical protein